MPQVRGRNRVFQGRHPAALRLDYERLRITWELLREMMSLRDAMNRLFEESVLRPGVLGSEGGSGVGAPLDVYETGAEAAAATAVVVGLKGLILPAHTMTVDRPFYVVIRDRKSGALLFLAHVRDPKLSV